MTNEEAIHELECNVDYKTPQIAQACRLAVRALEQQPSEDCVSREAVKELLKTEWVNYCMPMELDVNLSFVLSKIAEMPSVTPSYNSVKTELKPCEDCISREEVRRILANERDKLVKLHTVNPKDNPKADAMAYGVNWSLNTLMELPSVTPQQTRWIPVSERLPQTDGVYIVTRRLFDKQVDTEPYYIVDACYFDGSNTWHNDNRINHGRHLLEDIIAWMPRPKPYRESEEEK